MSRLILCSALALAAATPALARDPGGSDKLTAAFQNTIVSIYPDGRTARLWLNADGSYRAEGRRKDPSDGHWSVKGDRICLKQSHPFPAPFSYCTGLPSGAVGASWSAKAVTGEAVSVTLKPGRPSA